MSKKGKSSPLIDKSDLKALLLLFVGFIFFIGLANFLFSETDQPNNDFINTVPLDGKDIKIILSWDSKPLDLDLQVYVKYPDGHVELIDSQNKTSEDNHVNLLYNIVTGYGSEIINIYNFDSENTYIIVVNQVSFEVGLSRSKARVQIMGEFGNIYASRTIPNNSNASIWPVFELSKNSITPIQLK
jgi:hypothetical protein